MRLIFHLQTLLNRIENLLIKDLLADLEEELEIEIYFQQQDLNLIEYKQVDLVITDNYTTAKLLSERKTIQVIYWYRGWNDNLETNNQSDFTVVVTEDSKLDSLPDNLQERAVVIPFGVKEEFYKSISEEKLITIEKRRIIIPGYGLTRKEIEFLINAVELINDTCPIEVIILSRDELIFDTEVAYKVIDIESSQERIIQYASAELALVIKGKRNYRLTTLELMASQTPIIIIDKDISWNSIIDDYSELIEFNRKQIGVRALKLLRDNTSAKKLIKKGWEIAKSHQWQKTIQRWSDLITEESADIDLGISKERRIDIILVNNNKPKILKDCVRNIQENTDFNYRIVVIDNYGCRSSLQDFRSSSGLVIIEPKKGLGYAQAYNYGIKAGSSQYILLMDTSFRTTVGWLDSLLSILQRENEAAIVKPQIWNEDKERIGLELNELFEQTSFQSEEEWLNTNRAVYLFGRELVADLGYFDKYYSFYFETIDYLLQAKRIGYNFYDSKESNLYKVKQEAGFTVKESQELINDRELFIRRWKPADLK
ncbi:glycosyltransferase [Acetohalobium arabaticum]|uniref:glycosyltransferase n=1 Tax=Acetohalobium arabaticum TaxID=28187 RepID=UPI0005A1910D|nr:glycosyltransferase [Acetohalobium arabaticum]